MTIGDITTAENLDQHNSSLKLLIEQLINDLKA